MKIATYNINGINGRLPVLLRWLAETQPDVVCLQELKAETRNFPEDAIHKAGYQSIWLGEKSWNGVAILSRTEIRELRNDLPGEDEAYTHSRYIEGFTNGIVIGCIYLPNGNPYPGPKFDYKLRWFKRLQAHAQTLMGTGLPVMLVGDYNVMPTELDVYKPQKYVDNALFRTESREAYANLLSQGWTDAIRKLYPKERVYTFWDYLRNAYGRDAGLRLDHFLLKPVLAARLISGEVDKYVRGWEKSSDHAPVWIELSDDDQKTIVFTKNVQALLDGAPQAALPGTFKPMKPIRADQPFNDPDWLYEIKWDGYRALARVENNSAELVSGNAVIFEDFSPVNELLASWGLDVVLDGVIVALDEKGMANFGALESWQPASSYLLVYYVFDILWYKGKLLTDLPLWDRRSILEEVLPKDNGLVRISHVFKANGIAFYKAAVQMKLEGIIAKRANSLYTGDARSRDWLQVEVKRR